ncbi:hypothetical protein [Psychrosphaera algicola]|uniref:hypothetical protein n=1 Tax=Psychrosphaera algicola TaxID=3023714 RepID=UPI00351D863D
MARSKELGTTGVLIASAVALIMLGDKLGISLMEVMQSQFQLERDDAFDSKKYFLYLAPLSKTLARH